MTEAHLAIYGPSPTSTSDNPILLTYLYAEEDGDPANVLSDLDTAIHSQQAGLYSVQGVIFLLLPGFTPVTPYREFADPASALQHLATGSTGWLYTLTGRDTQKIGGRVWTVTVAPVGNQPNQALPKAIVTSTIGDLINNWP